MRSSAHRSEQGLDLRWITTTAFGEFSDLRRRPSIPHGRCTVRSFSASRHIRLIKRLATFFVQPEGAAARATFARLRLIEPIRRPKTFLRPRPFFVSSKVKVSRTPFREQVYVEPKWLVTIQMGGVQWKCAHGPLIEIRVARTDPNRFWPNEPVCPREDSQRPSRNGNQK
jgi:hypothetical protein